MFCVKIDVRYSETDKMGIVYHSRYFPWFEVARDNLCKSFGLNYSNMEKMGIMMPLADCYCKFVKGATYGDTVLVYASIRKLGVASCQFSYIVKREADDTLLAEGYTKHGFVDMDFKPINMKKKYREIYDIFSQMESEEE